MSEVTLLPIKPGTMTDADKTILREAGVIVVEHENPSELKLLRPGIEIESSTILVCAMKALAKSGQITDTGVLQRETFTKLLGEALSASTR